MKNFNLYLYIVYAVYGVLLCFLLAGAPVIIKQDVIADSSHVTLSVTYISEPPLMYSIWYINDENVNESNYSNHNDIFIQNTNVDVAVKYYKTPIIMSVCISKLSLHRAIAIVSHIDSISCHLKNSIGGREPIFDVSIITANDKEKRNTTYEITTDSGSISEDLITTSTSQSDGHVNEQGKQNNKKNSYDLFTIIALSSREMLKRNLYLNI